jgi:hypothetical protein
MKRCRLNGFVGGSPTANHFLLFVQKKVIKENHTPLPLHPSVLAPHTGGCGTRFAQTVLAAFHLLAQAEGAARGIEKPYGAPQAGAPCAGFICMLISEHKTRCYNENLNYF